MGQLLVWYSANNSLVIQSLSVLIGLLLCFFIFRLFFGSRQRNVNSDLGTESGAGVQALDAKINQILEAQNMVITAAKAGSAEASPEQIEKLQTEIFNLRQTLKEKESMSSAEHLSANQAVAAATAMTEVASSGEPASQDVAQYLAEIEELKSRLSDYEVIAEDISDLQSLRDQNQKLQAQLQELGVATDSVQTADLVPEPTLDSMLEQTPEPMSEPVTPTEATTATPAAAVDIDQLLQDINVSQDAQITDEDKDLIQQFEKIKGS